MHPLGHGEGQAVSIAFDDIPRPDFADAAIVAIPGGSTVEVPDASWWAAQIFSVGAAPSWIRALFAVRQALVGLIGIKKGDASVFKIDRVENGEALIADNDTHLDFRAAVSVDGTRRLVQVVTVVELHGWRGRLYWVPVSLLHGPVTRSMMKRVARNFAPSS